MALPPLVRRGTALLGASFALNLAALSLAAGPGSTALVRLTGDLRLAGAYFALYLLLAAAGAGLAGRAMDARGRRPVLVGAHLLGAAGFALTGLGVGAGSLGLYASGVGLFALGGGAIGLTRLAAADLYPPAQRGRGMAWVLVSATAGAVLGPILLVASVPAGAWLGRDPLALLWFFGAPLYLAGAALVALGPETSHVARDLGAHWPGLAAAPAPAPAGPPGAGGVAVAAPGETAQGPGAPPGPPPQGSRHAWLAGAAAVGLALAAMTSVMSVAGAALDHAGHGLGDTGFVFTLHFLGMYALSLGVGRVADRAGRRATILLGVLALGAGGATIAAWPGVEGLAAGLFLVGLGWCLAYLGGSTLLADVAPAHRRARVVGNVDLGASLLAAAMSAGMGWVLAAGGIGTVGLVAVAAMAVPALALATLREPEPGVYAPARASA